MPILEFINSYHPIIISVNFIPENISTDYAFFSNNKRYSKIEKPHCKIIVTSNLTDGNPDFIVNYNRVSGAFDQGCNSLIMLLKLLKSTGAAKISLAGADGYKTDKENYYINSMRSYTEHGNKFNLAVKSAIHNLGVSVNFITPSEYSE